MMTPPSSGQELSTAINLGEQLSSPPSQPQATTAQPGFTMEDYQRLQQPPEKSAQQEEEPTSSLRARPQKPASSDALSTPSSGSEPLIPASRPAQPATLQLDVPQPSSGGLGPAAGLSPELMSRAPEKTIIYRKGESPEVKLNLPEEFKKRDVQLKEIRNDFKQLTTNFKVLEEETRESLILVQQQWKQIQELRSETQEDSAELIEQARRSQQDLSSRISDLEKMSSRQTDKILKIARKEWERAHQAKVDELLAVIRGLQERVEALEQGSTPATAPKAVPAKASSPPPKATPPKAATAPKAATVPQAATPSQAATPTEAAQAQAAAPPKAAPPKAEAPKATPPKVTPASPGKAPASQVPASRPLTPPPASESPSSSTLPPPPPIDASTKLRPAEAQEDARPQPIEADASQDDSSLSSESLEAQESSPQSPEQGVPSAQEPSSQELPQAAAKEAQAEEAAEARGLEELEPEVVDGKKEGPYLKRVEPGDMADPAIVYERGNFRRDMHVGVIEWLDEEGSLVISVDRGEILKSDVLLEVARMPGDADFQATFAELQESKQHAAWLLATIRHVAQSGALSVLEELLESIRPPVSPGRAAEITAMNKQVCERVRELGRPLVGVGIMLDGILDGAEVPEALRDMGVIFHEHMAPEVALECVEVALALDPERNDFEGDRAQIYMKLGLPDEATEALYRLRSTDEDGARLLTAFLEALYPSFSFWPKDDALAELSEKAEPMAEVSWARDIEQMKWLIQATATRLLILQEAQLEALGIEGEPPDWMIPSLDALLPQGLVELDAHDEIDIEQDLIELLHSQRAEWSRLTWVCWLLGLEQLALPGEGLALRDIQRFCTAHEAWFQVAAHIYEQIPFEPEDEFQAELLTVPWCGMPISEIPHAYADYICRDCISLDNTLRWLTDPSCSSPFAEAEESP